ncbi:MAG: S1 RNA-binding domain-containing protein [Ardenticatenaceae bacterium]|nr:S1 RNA-binding domain-containing protein [Ardenticatenaceae bacterium]
MSSEDTTSLQELLDQHDYELPEVGDIRKGIIVAINSQGVIVDLGSKRDGLVQPSDLSKLTDEDRAALKVNDEIPVYVVNNEQPDSVIVSIHMAQLNQDWIDAETKMESGEIDEYEIIGYNKGGAIVPFGRLRGFVPASHLTDLTPGMSDRKRQQRLAKLRGEKLPMKVIEVDRRRRRLVLSQRDAQKEWEEKRKSELLESLNEGDVLKGTISGLRDFGVFVDLGGADGLVHISELAWHRIDHPREVVKVGDEIEVVVLKLDREEQRISLSRKQVMANPWDSVEDRYQVNQLVEGKITRILDYGAFAEIEPGIEGLLHVSQLSRTNVENVSEVVKEGETHLLRIVSIDPNRQRIGLSLKAVTAQEQIEWMAQHMAQSESDEDEVVDDEAVAAAETAVADSAVTEEE